MKITETKTIKTIIVAVALVIIGAIVTTYVYTQKESEIQSLLSEKTDLTTLMLQKDSLVNEMANSFEEIESNLKFIKEKRSQLSIQQHGEGSKDRKEALIDDITLMNTMLEESSKKITELEAKLRNSGMNLRAFEQRIAGLNKSVEDQNAEIAALTRIIEEKDFQLAELHLTIEKMHDNLYEKDEVIDEKERLIHDKTNQINTGHLVLGTYKELKEKGLLAREGGFLGIGGVKTIQSSFDPNDFTRLDIREITTIPVHTRKATVITDHPEDSYSFISDEGQIAYLQITNPDEFWRISKYAVIEIR